ncbi:MAG: hypothetical protein ACRCTY_10090, partial [Candidatus Adiutrix sp.]
MHLECNNCHKILNLPDEKVPIGKSFNFVCPHCKHRNSAFIETPLGGGAAPVGEGFSPETTAFPAPLGSAAAEPPPQFKENKPHLAPPP